MNGVSGKAVNRGYTLIEMAIVLIIIGLLMGGIFKGQELIASARAKALAAEIRAVPLMVYAYQDRFRSFPGDETAAQSQAAFGATAVACQSGAAGCQPGNGRLDGEWNATSAAAESWLFWQAVRFANLASGSANPADPGYAPRNATGGLLGVESGLDASGLAAPFIAGMRGSYYVCSDGIDGREAGRIDQALDDGLPATGTVRAVLSGSPRGTAAVSSLNDGVRYTVCAAF